MPQHTSPHSARPSQAGPRVGRCGLQALAAGAVLLAAAAGSPAAVVIPGDTLAVQLLQVETAIAAGQLVVAEDTDPLLAEASFGSSWARANSSDGTLRGLAEATDATQPSLQANSGLALQLLNVSARPASFAAGALRLDVHGSFGRSLPAAGSLGVAGNTLVATLGVVIVTPAGVERASGALSLVYSWTGEPGAAPPRISAGPESAGSLGSGFVLGGLSFDGSSLHATVSAPALELLPGETVAILADASGGAVAAGLLGATGFSASTDYGSTARLALALPAGFALQGAQPLDWVVSSPVPEPAAAGLLAAGLALLAWQRRRTPGRAAPGPVPLH